MSGNYRRILLKLSGEYFGGEKGIGFHSQTISMLSKQVCQAHEKGVELGIVLGGGNFFRGAGEFDIPMDRVAGDHIGMLATIMNSLCLRESLLSLGKKSRVMTGLLAPQVAEPFNKQKALSCLKEGEILIFAGGTGNPYFSTDSAAALRALEIEADVLIKGTKVDGVYDKDPKLFKDARKLEKLTFTDVLKKDLKVMDATAIALCRDNNLPLCVLDITQPDNLRRFLNKQEVGTFVS
ncbi:MAG: UMP kinase [Deltaproteobacteria bacterium]|nr:UMP kinase [Deltaproteobacteria bacterium]